MKKIGITSKKATNKSCSELNFVQKSLRVHMSISPQKRQITFNLELNATKNMHHIKKASNKSCLELNFLQKSLQAHMAISPPLQWS